MLTLYLIQSLLPLALIAWLAFAPPQSVLGFWVHALATGLTLVALGHVGIWTWPPLWALYVLSGLLIAAIIGGLARRRSRTRWPGGAGAWLCLVGFAGFGLYAADIIRLAIPATASTGELRVDLAAPLGPGTYLVANGGAATSVNAHANFLDQSVRAHRPYRGTSHGVDLVALDRWGLRADALLPTDPRRYVIFGRPVVAPCAGDVIAAVDGLPDMPVPQMDHNHLAGNHVILRCANADILLGHFRNGSLLVKASQRLVVGQSIAEVGNSGNTSEPHLHINAMRPGTLEAPLSGEPIPIRIEGQYLVRNDRFVVPRQRRQP